MRRKTFRRFPRTRRRHTCSNVTPSHADASKYPALNEVAILAGNARAADFANMLVEETGGRGMSGAVFDMCIHVYAADVEDISLEASRSEGADGWA